MFMQMMAYQNYMDKFRELLLIYAADKTIQMKEVWGSYASAVHYNMQEAEKYNLWQAASLPWQARNNFHTLYIHALKIVKRMEEH
jgi:hypothetical protein